MLQNMLLAIPYVSMVLNGKEDRLKLRLNARYCEIAYNNDGWGRLSLNELKLLYGALKILNTKDRTNSLNFNIWLECTVASRFNFLQMRR